MGRYEILRASLTEPLHALPSLRYIAALEDKGVEVEEGVGEEVLEEARVEVRVGKVLERLRSTPLVTTEHTRLLLGTCSCELQL